MRTFTLLKLALLPLAWGATPAQWRSKSIYQVITDRFALTSGSTTQECSTSARQHCGGTWQGLINQLDYIHGMGFTAVWISPIVANIEADTAYGQAYHGYWAQDINALNSRFGDAVSLQALASALHSRDMYLMVDIAPNHFAWAGSHTTVDYSTFTPFNSASYFDAFCWISNYDDQNEVEECWLGDDNVALVDVDTDQAGVQSTYNSWGQGLVSDYGIDGFRIDTAKHVEKTFWSSFNDAVGVYSVGEVLSGDRAYTCGYQGSLDGVLNYPIYYPLIRAFQSTSGSISELVSMISDVKDNCPDPTTLGTFTENHDSPRFASYTSDLALAKNVIAFNILADGIPIIYQGQEQRFSGAADPDNREALWSSGYNTQSELYTHIASLNQIRNQAINTSGDDYLLYENWAVSSGNNWLALRKGPDAAAIVAVLTNAGASGSSQTVSVSSTGYSSGTVVYDVLSCTTLTAGSGTLSVPLSAGTPRVFYPQSLLSGSGICGQ